MMNTPTGGELKFLILLKEAVIKYMINYYFLSKEHPTKKGKKRGIFKYLRGFFC